MNASIQMLIYLISACVPVVVFVNCKTRYARRPVNTAGTSEKSRSLQYCVGRDQARL
jgi:hypothetical protein